MNKADELFEKNLGGYSITPPVGTWEKVEARLSKKNRLVILVRWAAVFMSGSLLLGTWLSQNEFVSPLAQGIRFSRPEVEGGQFHKSPLKKKQLKKEMTPVNDERKSADQMNESVKQEVAMGKIATEELKTNQELISVSKGPEITKSGNTLKPIVLVYTLDPVEDHDPAHPDPKAVADSDQKNGSLMKVMRIAKDVKNSETALGGIRGMKEDLFALDLKKTTTKKH